MVDELNRWWDLRGVLGVMSLLYGSVESEYCIPETTITQYVNQPEFKLQLNKNVNNCVFLRTRHKNILFI